MTGEHGNKEIGGVDYELEPMKGNNSSDDGSDVTVRNANNVIVVRCRPFSHSENSVDNKEIPDEPYEAAPIIVRPHSSGLDSSSLGPGSSGLPAKPSSYQHTSDLRLPARVCISSSSTSNSVDTLHNQPHLVSSAFGGRSFLQQQEQQCHATVRERNASMLLNELMADVWFVVGASTGQTQRIPAHSYVLATGSTVFYAMFYGDFPKDTDVYVPDVEPKAFCTFLRYLYTDEIILDSDSVLSVLYVAKKYMITFLIHACIKFLDGSLTAKNVCLLLSQSRLFEEDELVQRCWKLIDAQTELALNSDGFLDIDTETLQSIITRDTLNVKEAVLFNAALRWTKSQCSRRNLDPTAQNARSVLGNMFYLIRVPAMRIDEFADGPAQSGLLSPSEVAEIFLFYTAKSKPSLPFAAVPRKGLPTRRCHRFQSSAYRTNQWRYRGRCDSIQFCTDRRIFVSGLGLFGSSNGASQYKVRMELKCQGEVLAQVDTWFYSDGSSNVFPVFFEHPIQVEPDVYNTASIILDGSELSYFGQEGMTEVQTELVLFQFQCSTESTNGTGVQGGQIPEILFFA